MQRRLVTITTAGFFLLPLWAPQMIQESAAASKEERLLEKWLPTGDPFNYDFKVGGVGAKLVAHYCLVVTEDSARITGWYYIRSHGHKISKNDGHTPLAVNWRNGSGHAERDFFNFKGYRIVGRLSVAPGKANVRLWFTGPGVSHTWINETLSFTPAGGGGGQIFKVWIENPLDKPIYYTMDGNNFSVGGHSTRYHWKQGVADFNIEFDWSFAPGYQRRAYRLMPASRNYFTAVGNGLDLYRR